MKPRQIVRVEVAPLQENNVRSSLGGDLIRLRDSLVKGQKNPILISGQKIIDGHRRVAAAKLAGITHLDAIDCGDMTPEEIAEWQTVHAFHSEALPDADRAAALKLDKDKGLSNTQIAQKFDVDPATVTKLLSLFDCPPEAQQAARAGKLGLNAWYQLARSLKGGGKPKPQTDAETKKADSVRIVLDGVTISLKGPGLTLSAVAKLLLDAGKEANAGVKEGQAASTFARLMADRAKKAEEAKAAKNGAAVV